VETFLQQLETGQDGPGEAYLPVLEALGRLCRGPRDKQVITVLRRYAPTWLIQLPSLLEESELKALQNTIMGAPRERMLREMAEAVEVLTAIHLLVLVLEDLHWSDPSTVALLAYLARWQEPLRLLVLGTYRRAEVLGGKHPLAAVQGELLGQGLCTEIALSFLSESAVGDYLRQRVPDREELRPLAVTLYRHTAGHPLFMVATVEEWLSQVRRSVGNGDGQEPESSAIFNGLIPERLRQLVSVQMERLPSREQRVLEAASVAGFEFSAAEVAAGLTADDVATEEQCERLVRQQQFLRPAGVSEWPDGTVAARYEFRHAVYQSLWQERVKAGRWRRYHQLIGERKEAAYGERANEIAAELALHFEQGGDYRKAIRYYHQAARTALTRSANTEAIAQLTKGLTLLERVPNILERPKQELALRITFGDVLRQAKGFGAPEVEQAYARAQALC